MRPILLHTLLAATFLSGCGSDDDGGGTLSDATVPLSNYGVIRVDHDSITAQNAARCSILRSGFTHRGR